MFPSPILYWQCKNFPWGVTFFILVFVHIVSSVRAGSFYVAKVSSSEQAVANAFKHDKGTINFRTCGDN